MPPLHRLFLALALAWPCQALFAGAWTKPTEEMTPSADGRHLFHVVPRVLPRRESQPPNEGLPSTSGSLEVCYGTLFRFEGGSYRPVWRAKLINAIAPGQVIPANDGQAVVTLGNWANEGNEDHILAVYGSEGKLLRKLKLEDIYSAEEIAQLPRSSAGISWSGKTRIDLEKHLFVMELATFGRQLRIDLRSGATVKAVE